MVAVSNEYWIEDTRWPAVFLQSTGYDIDGFGRCEHSCNGRHDQI